MPYHATRYLFYRQKSTLPALSSWHEWVITSIEIQFWSKGRHGYVISYKHRKQWILLIHALFSDKTFLQKLPQADKHGVQIACQRIWCSDLNISKLHTMFVCKLMWSWKVHFLVDMPMYTVLLTHWGRDKMAAIFQTTFSNPFSWMKMYEFRLRFHWSLFLRVQLTIFHHWFR